MPSNERKAFFHYLFTTAMEGGVNYWAKVDKYRWSKDGEPTLDEFHAILSSSEDDWGVSEAYISETDKVEIMPDECQNQPLRVDIKVISRGWYIFMGKVLAAVKYEDPRAEFSNPYFKQAIVQYLTNSDEGDSDSDVAELVVQLGLFGEHVYS